MRNSTSTQKLRLFISHTEQDEKFVIELIKHLQSWINCLTIDISISRIQEFTAGELLLKAIDGLTGADIILLILSADYLLGIDRGDTLKYQLEAIKSKHYYKQALIIPIVARDCMWDLDRFIKNLEVQPIDARRHSSYKIAEEVRDSIEEHYLCEIYKEYFKALIENEYPIPANADQERIQKYEGLGLIKKKADNIEQPIRNVEKYLYEGEKERLKRKKQREKKRLEQEEQERIKQKNLLDGNLKKYRDAHQDEVKGFFRGRIGLTVSYRYNRRLSDFKKELKLTDKDALLLETEYGFSNALHYYLSRARKIVESLIKSSIENVKANPKCFHKASIPLSLLIFFMALFSLVKNCQRQSFGNSQLEQTSKAELSTYRERLEFFSEEKQSIFAQDRYENSGREAILRKAREFTDGDKYEKIKLFIVNERNDNVYYEFKPFEIKELGAPIVIDEHKTEVHFRVKHPYDIIKGGVKSASVDPDEKKYAFCFGLDEDVWKIIYQSQPVSIDKEIEDSGCSDAVWPIPGGDI